MAQPSGVAPSTYARFYPHVQIMWLKLDENCGQDSAPFFLSFPRQSVGSVIHSRIHILYSTICSSTLRALESIERHLADCIVETVL